MPTRIQTGQTALFIGDSITDCGRRDERGRPLGLGYVRYVADLLAIREPEKDIRAINTGIGGNTVDDLRSRWVDDVLAHKPDWLSVKIGINDCNRFLTGGDPELYGPEGYERIYDTVLDVTRRELPDCRIVLIDPFIGSLDSPGRVAGAYRARVVETLPRYIDAVHRLSDKHGTRLVRTHEIFHEHFRVQPPTVFFPVEPVHPNQTGHLLIAEAVYRVLAE